jgi:hypothetical protein
MSKTITLAKPKLASKTIAEAAVAFAEAGTASEQKGAKQAASEKRAFFAPEGYRRLTINLPEELHKKLKQAALDADCTATDIVEKALREKLD